MPQAEDICEHVVMVHQGRKVLDDDLAAIRGRYDPRSIQFEPLEPDAETAALTAIPEVERVRLGDRGAEVLLRDNADPAAAMRRMLDMLPAARIELTRPRLEDIFIRLVAGKASVDEHDRLRDALGGDERETA